MDGCSLLALCAWRTTVLNWAPSLGHQLLRANHLVGTIPILYYLCKTFPDCWRSYHCSIRRIADWKEVVVVVVVVVEWYFANDHVHSWLWTSSCCCWLMFCKSSCWFSIVKQKMLLLIDVLQFIMLIPNCEEEAESSSSFRQKIWLVRHPVLDQIGLPNLCAKQLLESSSNSASHRGGINCNGEMVESSTWHQIMTVKSWYQHHTKLSKWRRSSTGQHYLSPLNL